jgi:hypothetical protein
MKLSKWFCIPKSKSITDKNKIVQMCFVFIIFQNNIVYSSSLYHYVYMTESYFRLQNRYILPILI